MSPVDPSTDPEDSSESGGLQASVVATTAAPVRDRAIDLAKGVAIILIVVGHVWRGMGAAGIVNVGTTGFQRFDTVLYAVHLPVFAFLAGLFVQRGVSRGGPWPYLRQRATLLVWLFLLWTVLQGIVRWLAAGRTNHPLTAWGFVESFWTKDSQLWFLPWLLFATALAVVIRPWRTRALGVCSLVVAIGVSLVLWGKELTIVGVAGMQLLPFFWVGTILRSDGLKKLMSRAPWWLLALTSTAVFALAVAQPLVATSTWSAQPATIGSTIWGIVAAVSGKVAVLAWCTGAGAWNGLTWLAFVGQRSLEIFLAHIIFAAGIRIALSLVGVHNVGIHLICGTLGGLVGSLALWSISRRRGLTFLFGVPSLFGRLLAPPHRGPEPPLLQG